MKWIKRIAWGLLFFLGIGLLLFYLFQERFVFLNGKRLPANFAFQFPQEFQEVNLITADNKTINALHFTLENPKGAILFFHGNRGNLNRWGGIVPYFLEYGYEVFAIDYRNYGKSTGSFNEVKMYEDALLAYKHLKQQYKEEQIVVYGRSLGCTFAAKVGTEHNPKHVILEAPFYQLKSAFIHNFSLSPTFLLNYHFKNDELVPKITSPTTIFHGNLDKTTSFKQSKNELFPLVGAKEKEFVEIPTGTHHNLKELKVYQKKLAAILD